MPFHDTICHVIYDPADTILFTAVDHDARFFPDPATNATQFTPMDEKK